MTRFYKHFFIYLSILARGHSSSIDINGEVSFDVKISDLVVPLERALDDYDLKKFIEDDDVKKMEKEKIKDDQRDMKRTDGKETNEGVKKRTQQDRLSSELGNLSGVTVAPIVECLYQYPNSEQFNAMLGNMMNQLTMVFVRVNKMMRRMNARRDQGTRFKVVDQKNTRFFENVYSNMTKEYSKLYNSTADHVARASNDPCENQEQLKEVWKVLLDSSLNSLRQACQSCIEEFLRSRGRSDDHKTKFKLGQYLVRELARIRSSQLDMLCDSFQLCYDELL
ncbi:hypothetical protein ABMA27_004088 [Loxostege sticticalis]|uniref:Uncharacterized protein n=1 Tax=Loxostege sticticalis TaxID=481309 RepID=A0ABR3HMD1_LOXSC